MNKEKMKFWIACPKCGQKFGVEPKLVMKYIGRVIDRHKHDISGIEEVLEAAQWRLGTEGVQKGQKRA